jgi:general secretion pathway protein C
MVGYQRGLAWARITLIALAAYAGAITVTAIVQYWIDSHDFQVESAARSQADLSSQTPADSKVDYTLIFQRNLFGSEASVAEGAPEHAASAVVDLALRGTAGIGSQGFAVFEETSSGKQDIFATGDLVFDGPKLVSVDTGSAVILRNGRRETFEIVSEETDKAPDAKRNTGAAADTGASGIRAVGGGNYLVDRREVEQTIENLNTVITQVRAVPMMKDGESMGFRLFSIRKGSVFDRMGLQNGDIVQRVNDVALTDPARAAGLLEEIQTADRVKVDLLRQDKPNTLTYKIQ